LTGGVFVACLFSLAVATTAGAQQRGDALTLKQALALAHETHPSVGAARASEEAASAAVGRAKSRWWPQLGTGASLVQYDEPMIVAPIHGFAPEEIAKIEFERTLIAGNVSLIWPLFEGGARGAQISGARSEAAGAAAGLVATEMGLTARVTVAYLEVLTAGGVLDAQDRRIESLVAERRRVDQLLAEGQAAQVELLRVEAGLAETEAERVATAARLDLAERELARLIDVPPAAARVERLLPVRLAEAATPGDRVEFIRLALDNNPELEMSRRRVETAEAGHRLAKAAWLPRLDVTSGYQAFSSDAGNTTDLWNVGIALSYPLFTGGDRSNAVGQARAQAEIARQELRLAELQAEEGVDRALNAVLSTGALVDALTRAVQHQSEVARIELLSLEAGAGTQTDYLRAEADLSRARSLLVEARHAEIAARVELARVIGELTLEWLDGNLEIAR
jgi:outer membrane protein